MVGHTAIALYEGWRQRPQHQEQRHGLCLRSPDGVQRRHAPPAHGSRVGSRHRAQGRGEASRRGWQGAISLALSCPECGFLTVHITTEIIFALFDLLGLRFTPRLRDIGSRRLYRSGAIDLHRYPRLQPHITGRINRQRVLEWWDAMLRAAGSMQLGHVTASLLVQKLQAYPQQNALAQALQEYGRLVRTLGDF